MLGLSMIFCASTWILRHSFCKEWCCNLEGNHTESADCFWLDTYFHKIVPNPWTLESSPSLRSSSVVFASIGKFALSRSFTPLLKLVPRCLIYLCRAIGNGIVPPDSSPMLTVESCYVLFMGCVFNQLQVTFLGPPDQLFSSLTC